MALVLQRSSGESLVFDYPSGERIIVHFTARPTPNGLIDNRLAIEAPDSVIVTRGEFLNIYAPSPVSPAPFMKGVAHDRR